MNYKIASLTKNEDFKSLIKGKKINNKYLTIFFKKLSDKNTNKLNISFVTKRKIGKAVIRNKIKRRLKNLMNEAVKKLDINLNYSYLFIAKKNIIEDQYELIKQNLFKDLKKIK
jgi:ribonuclease P protein component|tara:strand:- start:2432 stop:2773 length:342 start_codon:yes stop_codon:yes gene_type:complete